MRNLFLLGERQRCVEVKDHNEEQLFAIHTCHVPGENHDEASCTVLLTQGGLLIQATASGDIEWTCNLSEAAPGGKWFNATYIDSIDTVVCLSHGGGIVTIVKGQAELVGEFDFGLEAGQWSPDGEVLLLVTKDEGNSVMLAMNAQWEVMAEVAIESHVPESSVAVCWRPDGSACAISSVDVHDNTRRIRTYDRETLSLLSIGRSEDGSGKDVPNIHGAGLAWASGGCSNVLAAVQRKSKRTQQVVFFEPNGLRHREFALRPEDGSQPELLSLNWNVESDLLAVTLRESLHDKVQLWHRSNYHWYLKQELRFENGQGISCTKFHAEHPYKLLVALLYEKENETPQQMHWREFDFYWCPSTVEVSTRTPDSCEAFSIDGCILNVTPLEKAIVPPPMYAASVSMSRPIRGVSFVRDREHPVSYVLQLSDGSMVLLGANGESNSPIIPNYSVPNALASIRWVETESLDATRLRNILVMESEKDSLKLVGLHCPHVNRFCEYLVEIEVQWNSEGGTARVTNSIPLEGQVISMVHWSDSSEGALLHFSDGSLWEYSPQDSSVVPCSCEPFLEPCPWVAALKDSSSGKRLVVGLSAKSRLYCEDRLLADSASSFVLSTTHQFLCYASAAGSHAQLRFLPLSQVLAFDPFMGSDENHLLEGYEPRNVERGTRLVAVLPSNPTAVLQLPRGNLEGVYPRALVLPYVMSKIEAEQYGVAFEMMRRQRIDLNLIVDMNPRHFLDSGARLLLQQVKQVDFLNLFIATLKDVNVTEFRYRIPQWLERKESEVEAESEKFDFSTKTNRVCLTLRGIMLASDDDHGQFLLPILSTFAKENPPQLESALSLVKENALSRHSPNVKKPPLFSDAAQSSIKYLAFLADYDLLFDTALGLYDFDLARAVARHSQMDPKVYLPLLKRLKSLDKYYAQYEVDVRLKRFESALDNLFRSAQNNESLDGMTAIDDCRFGNDFDQVLGFIEDHDLHKLGLTLYEDIERRNRILKSLGDRLMKEHRASSALSIYLSCEPPDQDGAKRAARSCGDWRYYFTMSLNDEMEDDMATDARMSMIASEIADEIVAADKVGGRSKRNALAEAARVLLDYGKDVYGAVDMLIDAEMWSEGRRVARLHSRQDLEKKCTDAAVSFSNKKLREFEDRSIVFAETNARYAEIVNVRRDAIRNGPEGLGDGDAVGVDDDRSLFSAASNTSNTSLYSTMSGSSVTSTVSSVISVGNVSSFSMTGEHDVNRHKSKFNKLGKQKKKKKRRPPKKQRNRMKPGSQEELESLILLLKANCINDFDREVISETITFLVQVGRLSLARELFNGYNDLKTRIRASQKERIGASSKQRMELERASRRGGEHYEHVELPTEGEVDLLDCGELPVELSELFSFL